MWGRSNTMWSLAAFGIVKLPIDGTYMINRIIRTSRKSIILQKLPVVGKMGKWYEYRNNTPHIFDVGVLLMQHGYYSREQPYGWPTLSLAASPYRCGRLGKYVGWIIFNQLVRMNINVVNKIKCIYMITLNVFSSCLLNDNHV